MTTKLATPIRREIVINGEPHTVVISGAGIVLTKKRARSGIEISWARLLMPPAKEVFHDDIVEILHAMRIGDHARPYSAHEVVHREILPALRARLCEHCGEPKFGPGLLLRDGTICDKGSHSKPSGASDRPPGPPNPPPMPFKQFA